MEKHEESPGAPRFCETKGSPAHNERLRENLKPPKDKKERLEKHRHIQRAPSAHMKSSGECRHRGRTSSEMIVLAKENCEEDRKTTKSKRRVRKRRIQVALRQTNTSTPNKSQSKPMTCCELIAKTKKAPRRASIHIERPCRHVRFSKTRGTIPRPFHGKFAPARPFRYPGQAIIHKSRLLWSDSAERTCHKRYKHRWKLKHGQPLPWCGYYGHDTDYDHNGPLA